MELAEDNVVLDVFGASLIDCPWPLMLAGVIDRSDSACAFRIGRLQGLP